MLTGGFAAGTVVCLALSFALNQPWTAPVWYGLLMGAASFAANAAMYRGLAAGKASPVALLVALPAVPVVLTAYLLWGERLTPGQWMSFLIIIAGVALVRLTGEFSWQQREGMKWGLAAMLCFALNDLTNKQATLSGAAPFPTLALMFAGGTALFGGWRLLGRFRRSPAAGAGGAAAPGADAGDGDRAGADGASASAGREDGGDRTGADGPSPGAAWSAGRTFLWGMPSGVCNAVGAVLLFRAFETGITGLVSAILSLNVVILLLYARFVAREPFRPLETAGIAISLTGVVVLQLVG